MQSCSAGLFWGCQEVKRTPAVWAAIFATTSGVLIESSDGGHCDQAAFRACTSPRGVPPMGRNPMAQRHPPSRPGA